MKITTKLIALAVLCVGIPATVVAKDSGNSGIVGPWALNITVHNRTFTALSTLNEKHQLMTIDYAAPSILGPSRPVEVGYGIWTGGQNGHFLISYKSQLPHHMTRVVRGAATLTAPGVLMGNAQVTFLDEEGRVVYADTASVSGTKATGELAASR
jgi:hypothetical protein